MFYRYDVALSFAEQDKPYVSEVATLLRRQGIKAFYYPNHIRVGEDLDELTIKVYKKQSRYAAIFISKHYAKEGLWSKIELKTILERAKTDKKYLLPIRIDDTVIKEINQGIVWLDAGQMSPAEITLPLVHRVAPRAPWVIWAAAAIMVIIFSYFIINGGEKSPHNPADTTFTKKNISEQTDDSLYIISYNGEQICFLDLPKELQVFSVYKQKGNDFGENSSEWFTLGSTMKSDLMDRKTFIKNLGLIITIAETEKRRVVVSASDGNSWGTLNYKIKYGRDKDNLEALKESAYWHPGDKKMYGGNNVWLDYSILKISFKKEPISKENENTVTRFEENSPKVTSSSNEGNLYTVSYEKETYGYISLPPEAQYFAVYLQEAAGGASGYLIDPETGREVNKAGREEFLKGLGKYFHIAKQQNKRLIVTSENGSKFLSNNNIKFGKSKDKLEQLEVVEMQHPIDKVNYKVVGWINRDYM
jgi:hypothetical protein